jgi:hypothetical protein
MFIANQKSAVYVIADKSVSSNLLLNRVPPVTPGTADRFHTSAPAFLQAAGYNPQQRNGVDVTATTIERMNLRMVAEEYEDEHGNTAGCQYSFTSRDRQVIRSIDRR